MNDKKEKKKEGERGGGVSRPSDTMTSHIITLMTLPKKTKLLNKNISPGRRKMSLSYFFENVYIYRQWVGLFFTKVVSN